MTTRRDFIKKAAYSAPVILTLAARPSFAGQGSGHDNKADYNRKKQRVLAAWRRWWHYLRSR